MMFRAGYLAAFLLLSLAVILPDSLKAQTYSTNNPEPAVLTEPDLIYFRNYASELRDINQAAPGLMTRFLLLNGFSEKSISALLQWRDAHGGIFSMEELIGAGLTGDEVGLLKKYFICGSTRKSAEEIISSLEGSELLENIDYYNDLLIHPLNIEVAPAADLENLPGFDHQLAVALIQYRESTPLKGLLDLTNAGISSEELYTISPFITIKASSDRGLVLNARTAYYKPSEGSSDLWGLKLSFSSGHFASYFGVSTASNFTTFVPWQNVSENARFYLSWQEGPLKLFAGHYKVYLGQNLLYGAAYAPAVGEVDGYPVVRSDRGIDGYTGQSSDPDGDRTREFLSGMAASYDLQGIDVAGISLGIRVLGFYSAHGPDSSSGLTNQNDYGLDLKVEIPSLAGFLGYTITHEDRADLKYNLDGSSFHYEIYPLDWLGLNGESALTTGGSFIQGIILNFGKVKGLISGYFSGTNFIAPMGLPYLETKAGTKGIYAGISVECGVLKPQIWSEWSAAPDAPALIRSRTEGRVNLRVSHLLPWLSSLTAEIKSRYSSLVAGNDLRSGLSGEAGFFGDKLLLSASWLNYIGLSQPSQGEMVLFKGDFQPIKDWKAGLSWGMYQADNYNSSLYRAEEGSLPGSAALTAYYGKGVFWSLSALCQLSDELRIGIRYRKDNKENAPVIEGGSCWVDWSY